MAQDAAPDALDAARQIVVQLLKDKLQIQINFCYQYKLLHKKGSIYFIWILPFY